MPGPMVSAPPSPAHRPPARTSRCPRPCTPCSTGAWPGTTRCSSWLTSASPRRADSPGELEHVLQFIPPHPRLPTVHLNRGINLLNEQSRATVGEFADRFAGRIGGLVVHDHRDMGNQTDRLLTVLRELNARLCELPDGPLVFLEYAAGLEPGWFVELAEKLQDAERVSCCIDIGHLGRRQASARFARSHPGLNLHDLSHRRRSSSRCPRSRRRRRAG